MISEFSKAGILVGMNRTHNFGNSVDTNDNSVDETINSIHLVMAGMMPECLNNGILM